MQTKKLISCLAMAAFGSLSLIAQDGVRKFKSFKGDISMGFAAPTSTGSNAGILFAFEPKYAMMDQLCVGLRMEGTLMARYFGTDPAPNTQVDDAKGIASYIATVDYYFTNKDSFRPFVGTGPGIFIIFSDITNYEHRINATKFGGIIRAGGEVKHFRFGIEYNIIPNTDFNFFDNMGNTLVKNVRNGYFGIKAGFYFGGGPL